jgi:hypothetical protein
MAIAKDRLFVAGNGPAVDRFMEIDKGVNYLWDGTDWSIGTNAAMVFGPSSSPVQLAYYPDSLDLFPPEYRGRFYVALSGAPKDPPGPDAISGAKSIIEMHYDFSKRRLVSVPKHFVRYRGKGSQMIVGLALGPDGLYFVPIFPDKNGVSGIFKIKHDPDNPHPFTLDQKDAVGLMRERACYGCHAWRGEQPPLAPDLAIEKLGPRLEARLNSDEYLQEMIELDQDDASPFREFRDTRRRIREAEGSEKLRLWITNKVQEPRFDNRGAQMPKQPLSEQEAQLIADFLLTDYQESSILDKVERGVREFIGTPTQRRVIQFFAFGFLMACGLAVVLGIGGFLVFRSRN